MSDLTERLRALSKKARHSDDDLCTADEAADRIEELESTLKEYAKRAHDDYNA